MMIKIRESARTWLGYLLLFLMVIALGIVFGLGGIFDFNPKEVLVEVDSHEIMVSQYLSRYQEALDRLRQQFPDNAEALANQLNLRQQVLDQLVDRYLVLLSADRAGLRVTDQEVREVIAREPAFQVNSRFDYETYRQVLFQNNRNPNQFEIRIRDDLLVSKLQRGVVGGMVVGEAEVAERYRIENERVEVDYLFVDPKRFKAPDKPGEEEIQAYYEKNSQIFTQPARFKVRYFLLGLSDLEKSAKVSARAVERYYQRNLDTEFSSPKKVRASHILKRIPKDAGPDQEQQVRAAMEKILARARSGEDFAKLARTHSEDFSKDKGGDLGLFSQGEMVPQFADVAFSLESGGISDLVRTPFGLHIIKVTGVQAGQQKSLEDVRAEIREKLAARWAERQLDIRLERLPGRLKQEGLEAEAGKLGVKLTETPYFDGNGVLNGLGPSAALYGQVSTRRKGYVGVWRRNPVLGHVFYEVTGKEDAFVKPLKQVRGQVAAGVLGQKRNEAALAEAKSTLDTLKAPGDFDAYARRRKLPVQAVSFTVVERSIEGLGVNPDFQRSGFKLTAEKPFALNIKDGKAYLMRFKRRFYQEPEKEAEVKAAIRERMTDTYRQYVIDNEIKRLRGQVEINLLAPEYVGVATTASVPPIRN